MRQPSIDATHSQTTSLIGVAPRLFRAAGPSEIAFDPQRPAALPASRRP